MTAAVALPRTPGAGRLPVATVSAGDERRAAGATRARAACTALVNKARLVDDEGLEAGGHGVRAECGQGLAGAHATRTRGRYRSRLSLQRLS